MSAEQALFDAYREWRRLTVAAGRAIRQRNWDFLRECQQVTQRLQPLVSRLTHEAREEWQRFGADRNAKELAVQAKISDLIGLVQQNQELLSTAREAAVSERGRLEQAGQNLRLLQQSYAFVRPAGWTSFS